MGGRRVQFHSLTLTHTPIPPLHPSPPLTHCIHAPAHPCHLLWWGVGTYLIKWRSMYFCHIWPALLLFFRLFSTCVGRVLTITNLSVMFLFKVNSHLTRINLIYGSIFFFVKLLLFRYYTPLNLHLNAVCCLSKSRAIIIYHFLPLKRPMQSRYQTHLNHTFKSHLFPILLTAPVTLSHAIRHCHYAVASGMSPSTR